MFGTLVFAATLAGLTVVPFGNLSEKLKERSPWQGYSSEDHYGLVVQAQNIAAGESGKNCQLWAKALASDEMGADHAGVPVTNWEENFFRDWSPWTDREVSMIRNCNSLPCDIKINPSEMAQLEKSPRDLKREAFRDIVGARLEEYRKTGEIKGYEYPGALMDPWGFFEKHGFRTTLPRPSTPKLWARRFLPESDDTIQIRQVMDRRPVLSADGNEAVVWMRAVYSDHFFDSWGEWLQVKCAKDGSGTFIQALLLEVDLLKKNDLVSKIARGKIRAGIGERGKAYQQAERDHLLKIVREEKKAAPSEKSPEKK